MRGSVVPLFIPHAGCGRGCVFCDQHAISGAVKPVTADDVRRETLAAAALTGKRDIQLCFYGGSFTALPEAYMLSLLDAAAQLHKEGVIGSIRYSTRPDAITPEKLELTKGYPIRVIELGAQSMDDGVLARARRGHTAKDTEAAVALIRERTDCKLVLQMMTGLPGADVMSDVRTARRIAALKPERVRIYPAVVLEGTEMAQMWRRGEYNPPDVADAAGVCGVLIEFFEGVGIKVIRAGLSPSDGLRARVLAGAYHPAFGELARSTIYLRRARSLIMQIRTRPKRLNLIVNPRCISLMAGQKRENLKKLSGEFAIPDIRVRAEQVKIGEVLLELSE